MRLNSSQKRICQKIIRRTNANKKYYHEVLLGIKLVDEKFLTPRFRKFLKVELRKRGYRIKFWRHTKRAWIEFNGDLQPGTRQAVYLERRGIEKDASGYDDGNTNHCYAPLRSEYIHPY